MTNLEKLRQISEAKGLIIEYLKDHDPTDLFDFNDWLTSHVPAESESEG